MEDLRKALSELSHQELDVVEEKLESMLLKKSLNDFLAKGGKKAEVGEMREWSNGKYVKHADGWVKVGGEHHGKLMGKFKDAPKKEHSEFADKNNKSLEEIAKELGAKAFAAGRKAIPIQDPELMKLLEENKGKEVGSSSGILEAWSKGFHEANLKAPVPEKQKESSKPAFIMSKEFKRDPKTGMLISEYALSLENKIVAQLYESRGKGGRWAISAGRFIDDNNIIKKFPTRKAAFEYLKDNPEELKSLIEKHEPQKEVEKPKKEVAPAVKEPVTKPEKTKEINNLVNKEEKERAKKILETKPSIQFTEDRGPLGEKGSDEYGETAIVLGDGSKYSRILGNRSKEEIIERTKNTIDNIWKGLQSYKMPQKQWQQEYKKIHHLNRLTKYTKFRADKAHKESVEIAIRAGKISPNDSVVDPYLDLKDKYGAEIKLPSEINPKVQEQTNLIKSINFSKTTKTMASQLTQLVNESGIVLAEMNIKLKSPLNFTCSSNVSKTKNTRGTYNSFFKELEILDIKEASTTVMHEIGHAVDYAMQEEKAPKGRLAEILSGFKTKDPELDAKYLELYSIVTNSDFYTKVGAKDRSYLSYLKKPTEVFARAFEVYSRVKAEKLVKEGKISKEFLETFSPAIYQTESQVYKDALVEYDSMTQKVIEVNSQISTFRRAAAQAAREEYPAVGDFEKRYEAEIKYLEESKEYQDVMEEKQKLQEEREKVREKIRTSYHASIPPEKQKEYETKISDIMEYIFKNDKIRKSLSKKLSQYLGN